MGIRKKIVRLVTLAKEMQFSIKYDGLSVDQQRKMLDAVEDVERALNTIHRLNFCRTSKPRREVAPITNEQEFDAAVERMKGLLNVEKGTPGYAELEELISVVHAYDREHHPVPDFE